MKTIKSAEKKTYKRDRELTESVMNIIDNVRENGDNALFEYARKFDNIDVDSIRVSEEEVKSAYDKIDSETLEAIRFAESQIRFFAEKQRECLKDLTVQSKVPGLRRRADRLQEGSHQGPLQHVRIRPRHPQGRRRRDLRRGP